MARKNAHNFLAGCVEEVIRDKLEGFMGESQKGSVPQAISGRGLFQAIWESRHGRCATWEQPAGEVAIYRDTFEGEKAVYGYLSSGEAFKILINGKTWVTDWKGKGVMDFNGDGIKNKAANNIAKDKGDFKWMQSVLTKVNSLIMNSENSSKCKPFPDVPRIRQLKEWSKRCYDPDYRYYRPRNDAKECVYDIPREKEEGYCFSCDREGRVVEFGYKKGLMHGAINFFYDIYGGDNFEPSASFVDEGTHCEKIDKASNEPTCQKGRELDKKAERFFKDSSGFSPAYSPK